ncbi:hypothetical protein [Oerskovia rustica]|uniref:Small secreted protein n=1 Tax=Oerskovia rustica TaxID=2762237 RepID=A0ABR8RRS5_9CELL|nr:hypothetical protein [Oerskovia rustica]MBD7950429.1 hypothetical protein [Oerskovia rustica]
MTNRKSTTTTLGGIATAVLLTFSLAACSGGGADVAAFCKASEDLDATMADVDPSDLASTGGAFTTLAAEMEKITAPDDVAADWKVLTGAMGDAGAAFTELNDLDPTDPAFVDKATAVGDDIQSDEVTAAMKNLETFSAENCKA